MVLCREWATCCSLSQEQQAGLDDSADLGEAEEGKYTHEEEKRVDSARDVSKELEGERVVRGVVLYLLPELS